MESNQGSSATVFGIFDIYRLFWWAIYTLLLVGGFSTYTFVKVNLGYDVSVKSAYAAMMPELDESLDARVPPKRKR